MMKNKMNYLFMLFCVQVFSCFGTEFEPSGTEFEAYVSGPYSNAQYLNPLYKSYNNNILTKQNLEKNIQEYYGKINEYVQDYYTRNKFIRLDELNEVKGQIHEFVDGVVEIANEKNLLNELGSDDKKKLKNFYLLLDQAVEKLADESSKSGFKKFIEEERKKLTNLFAQKAPTTNVNPSPRLEVQESKKKKSERRRNKPKKEELLELSEDELLNYEEGSKEKNFYNTAKGYLQELEESKRVDKYKELKRLFMDIVKFSNKGNLDSKQLKMLFTIYTVLKKAVNEQENWENKEYGQKRFLETIEEQVDKLKNKFKEEAFESKEEEAQVVKKKRTTKKQEKETTAGQRKTKPVKEKGVNIKPALRPVQSDSSSVKNMTLQIPFDGFQTEEGTQKITNAEVYRLLGENLDQYIVSITSHKDSQIILNNDNSRLISFFDKHILNVKFADGSVEQIKIKFQDSNQHKIKEKKKKHSRSKLNLPQGGTKVEEKIKKQQRQPLEKRKQELPITMLITPDEADKQYTGEEFKELIKTVLNRNNVFVNNIEDVGSFDDKGKISKIDEGIDVKIQVLNNLTNKELLVRTDDGIKNISLEVGDITKKQPRRIASRPEQVREQLEADIEQVTVTIPEGTDSISNKDLYQKVSTQLNKNPKEIEIKYITKGGFDKLIQKIGSSEITFLEKSKLTVNLKNNDKKMPIKFEYTGQPEIEVQKKKEKTVQSSQGNVPQGAQEVPQEQPEGQGEEPVGPNVPVAGQQPVAQAQEPVIPQVVPQEQPVEQGQPEAQEPQSLPAKIIGWIVTVISAPITLLRYLFGF